LSNAGKGGKQASGYAPPKRVGAPIKGSSPAFGSAPPKRAVAPVQEGSPASGGAPQGEAGAADDKAAKKLAYVTSARDVAAHALVRVWQQAAFASAALDAEVSKARLDPRDAGLATELCYGVLRVEPALLAKLKAVSDGFRAPSGLVRAHLLIAAYTLCFLDRVPPFAAVSEAVLAARRVADARVGGFVNAVLRRLAADVEKKGRPSMGDMVVKSCPAWLSAALGRALPKADVPRYLAEGPSAPPHALCLADAADREPLMERLRAAAPQATFEAGSASPRAVRVIGAGDLRGLPGFGVDFLPQEEGAQVIALALGARPGERVLDACAGHGNKSWLLAHEVGPEGAVDAADLHAPKLRALEAALAGKTKGSQTLRPPLGTESGPRRRSSAWRSGVRSGRAQSSTFVVDWSKGGGDVPGGFDRVLVDAPCSGTGTLRRRPEIAQRRTAEDVARLAALQLAILRNAAACVHTDGRLVYAVCSVLREEAEAVVEAAIAQGAADGARLEPLAFDAPAVQALFGETSAFRLLPHVHGTDGYFAASFAVRR
jgi:16S rRNA (cytosine967-C5)-methyltransferase